MSISKRASLFLQKSERNDSQLTEADIRLAFLANEAPIFEPLIDFQLTFGGFVFYAGLVPIHFNLLKGAGGYPTFSNTAVIEFEESESATPKYFYDCASTDYQMQFSLDENGIYYEDREPKSSSFKKAVEELALWDEMNQKGNYELAFSNEKLSHESIDKHLQLKLIPEASDQYTLWFFNDYMYMKQQQGLTTLAVSNHYQGKSKLQELLVP